MFFFQLMRKARIGLVCLINDARNPRRHKILRPHRKHSPKSTVKFQRPTISKQIIFDRRDCVCVCVRQRFYACLLFRRETVNVTVIAQYSRELNYYYFIGGNESELRRDFFRSMKPRYSRHYYYFQWNVCEHCERYGWRRHKCHTHTHRCVCIVSLNHLSLWVNKQKHAVRRARHIQT